MYPLPTPALLTNAHLLIDLQLEVSLRILDAMRKLSEINLQLGRDLIAEAGANTQRLMASKDATQLSAAIASHMAPGRQSLQTYQHRMAEQLAQFQPVGQLLH
jgi:hypothetical protein